MIEIESYYLFCDIIALVVCCLLFVVLALTKVNTATKESETVNGLKLVPTAKPSSQKAMAPPSNNAVKGILSMFRCNFCTKLFFFPLYFVKIT